MLNLFERLQATSFTFNPPKREIFSNIVRRFLSICILVYLYISWILQICQVTRAQSEEKNLNGVARLDMRGEEPGVLKMPSVFDVFKREWKLDNGNYRPLLHKPRHVYVWGWEQDICLSDGKSYWRTFIHMFISLSLHQFECFTAELKLFLRKLSNSIHCDNLRKNGCMNNSHRNSFCSCVMNEAHCGVWWLWALKRGNTITVFIHI